MNRAVALGARVAAAGCLATSGVIHAELYLHGYRTIPGVGPAFLLQASGALAGALLLLLTTTAVLRLAAAGLALDALGGFAASRTIGIFGFIEYGLKPAPQAPISVLAEIATWQCSPSHCCTAPRPVALFPSSRQRGETLR